jgi:hypothetical protein
MNIENPASFLQKMVLKSEVVNSLYYIILYIELHYILNTDLLLNRNINLSVSRLLTTDTTTRTMIIFYLN